MNKHARLCRFLALYRCSGASRRSQQRTIITALFALVAITGLAQEKEQKDNTIYLHSTAADGFTKAALMDVKVILMREDSTVVDTTETYESYGYSSGIGRHLSTSHYYFNIKREPAKYIIKAEHPNYETTYANFEMKQVYKKQTEENKYLGIENEDKKEYTMDVILKREYSIGGSANVSTKASGS